MYRRAASETTLTTPIADYFDTTDPLTHNAIQIRRLKMWGPLVVTKPGADFTAYRATIHWKGNMLIRDGDDVVMYILQSSGGNLAFQTTTQIRFAER